MGFFSWKTADTKESIKNIYTGEHRTVYLLLPGRPPIKEEAYDGYGVFGGRDAYAILAQENGVPGITGHDDDDRDLGIRLQFDCPKHEGMFELKFSFDENAKYEDLPPSDICPTQGFFIH